MSNAHNTIVPSVNVNDLKVQYLDLISQGYTELVALEKLNFPKALYLKLLLDDNDFVLQVENCRKLRAEFWVSKIAATVDQDFSKDEVGSERLKFDKLQFLARADNPDKYGNNTKKLDVSIDLGKFKLLPPEEALKSLASDPFAIDADFKELNDEELL